MHADPSLTTADEREAQHLTNRRRLGWLRNGIAMLALAFSVAVVGCAAHAYQLFQSSSKAANYYLSLWPGDVDERPLQAILASGSLIAVGSLAFLIASFILSPRPRAKLLNIVSAVCAFSGLFLSIFSVAFSLARGRKPGARGTVTSWSCRWSNMAVGPPVQFGEICRESSAALDLMAVLIAIEIVAAGCAALGFWIESRMERMRLFEESKDVEELS